MTYLVQNSIKKQKLIKAYTINFGSFKSVLSSYRSFSESFYNVHNQKRMVKWIDIIRIIPIPGSRLSDKTKRPVIGKPFTLKFPIGVKPQVGKPYTGLKIKPVNLPQIIIFFIICVIYRYFNL